MKRKLLFILTFISLGFLANAKIVYVNAIASGNNNGASWTDAYTDLNNYLSNFQQSYDTVYIAEGTYKPALSSLGYPCFVFTHHLFVYGGFPNTGNPIWSDRDWVAHPTIFDGDLNGDDDLTFSTRSDNAKRIIVTDTYYVLDGFTIQNGGDDSGAPGAGIAMGGTSSREGIVRNCIFKNNYVSLSGTISSEGGAIRASAATETDTLILENVTFINNQAAQGGAVNANAVCIASNCKFIKNVAGRGSAINVYKVGSSSTSDCYFTNCLFYKNLATSLYTHSGTINRYGGRLGTINFTNCTFKENFTTDTLPTEEATIYDNNENNNPNVTNFNNCLFEQKGSVGKGFDMKFYGEINFYHCMHNYSDDADFLDGIDDTNSNVYISTAAMYTNHGILFSTADTLNGIFILNCDSAFMDLGDSTMLNGLPHTITTDLNGAESVQGNNIEIGAFESNCSQSSNTNFLENTQITIYPNPTTNSLNILANELQIKELSVLDMSGKMLINSKNAVKTLEMSSLSSGMYILKIVTNKGIARKRFIKQ